MDGLEEAVLRNRQRSTIEYRQHLTDFLRRHITEVMSDDEWAAVMNINGSFLDEQPNGSEEKDDEDPLFAEKKKEYSLALRLAKHIRYPVSSPLPFYPPAAAGDLRAEALPPEFDEAVAEAVDDSLLTPRPMEEMEGLGLDEENRAQAYYIEKGNDKKILFAMAIGINDKLGQQSIYPGLFLLE